MTCKEIKKYLPFYPGELDTGIRQSIDMHLSHCEKCRALHDSLNLYRAYAVAAPAIEAPDNFENSVMAALENAGKISRQKRIIRTTLLVATSAAAILILFLILRSTVPPWENATETSFMLNLEKAGKGPTTHMDFERIDNSLSIILEESKAHIEKKGINTRTGYYDYIIIAVEAGYLDAFISKYNKVSSQPLPRPESGKAINAVSYYKIYFDVINFNAADIDGDSRADLIVQFLSGRYKGQWIACLNTDTSRFTENCFLDIGKDVSEYLGDYTFVCGDFNGDGLDDICLYAGNEASGLSNQILLNKGNYYFKEAERDFTAGIIPATTTGIFFRLLSGDMNHDGKDELLKVTYMHEDQYGITLSNAVMGNQVLRIPDLSPGNGTIMAGDMNGDGYADICVKYLAGQRGGQTWVYENLKKDFSNEPVDMGLSFFGDYIFSIADYDGDGFDDLFVKSGGPFLSGDWYIMKNTGAAKFIFGYKFELEFSGE